MGTSLSVKWIVKLKKRRYKMRKWIIASMWFMIPVLLCFITVMCLGIIVMGSTEPLVLPLRGKVFIIVAGALGMLGVAVIFTTMGWIVKYVDKINKLEEETDAYVAAKHKLNQRTNVYNNLIEEIELKKAQHDSSRL